jgi:hypothetical protein
LNVIPQIITTKECADDLYSILDIHNTVYSNLNAFSSFELSEIILLLDELPWEFFAGIITGYLGHKNTKIKANTKRRVVIRYPDNSMVDATNIPPDELKEIIHPHKQIYISMYEEDDRS